MNRTALAAVAIGISASAALLLATPAAAEDLSPAAERIVAADGAADFIEYSANSV